MSLAAEKARATLGSPPIPSRQSNPFATCWTRPGVLPFVADEEASAESLFAAWSSMREAQLVGEHGSGKTTLVEALLRRLPAEAEVARWTLDGRHAAKQFPGVARGGLLVVDGYEQLGAMARWRVRRSVRRLDARLLVTTHRRVRRFGRAALPVLAELSPSIELTLKLFDRLTERRPAASLRTEVAECYRRCRGNLREVWFELYDRHERNSR